MKSSKFSIYGAFASYDFSNSGYVAVFQSFLLPIVVASSLETAGAGQNMYWPLAVGLSSLIAVVCAPFAGRMADYYGKHKLFLMLLMLTALPAAASPYLLHYSVYILIAGFIVFNVFFELTQSIYDSFLANLAARDEEITSLSAFGWGFGYLGGAFFAALYLVMEHLEVTNAAMLMVFGALFFVLSLPFVRFLFRISHEVALRDTGRDRLSFKNLRPPVTLKVLFVYWIIADTVAGIMYFTPLYLSSELGFSITTIGALMLGGQLVAFPATVAMGAMANRIGRVTAIRASLVIWGVGMAGLAMSSSLLHVAVVLLVLSLVIGSTQAILRAHFASQAGVHRSGEGLGFFAVAQKSASVVAPLIVGGSIAVTGKIAPAFMLFAGLLFVGLLVAGNLDRKPVGE